MDSYCSIYQKIIRVKGDGTIQAPLPVKQRIAANEVTFRCLCETPDAPICKAPK